ncbi:hypothetical protein H4J59_08165 [Colwellia sp. MB02u-10]|jgi:hypothetical protein|uniref:hypothetical protein n=1 Tax=Colwellia sp. MB02u-10 TaxID=2759828 RepID=UPI0015F43326|nr:hypothetical protein [Colwellia sp. MB02u-10]MBA6340962.1 hypothetical protein [Colwellia sp. MB02u-10]
MSFKSLLSSFLIPIFLASCTFIPAIATKQPYYNNCDMLTKKLTLESTQLEDLDECNDKTLGECLVIIGIIGSASYIISGSIVLVGNTLHWSEHNLSC